MATPKVSVIMPAFNAEKFIAEAIESVLNQTMKQFELIIVNDGSTDATAKIVKSYKDKRIRYFEYYPNKGKTIAANLGLKKAQGKFACIFDADDIMVNFKLDVSSKILEKHKECSLLFGNAWIMSQKSEILSPLVFPSRKRKSIDTAFPTTRFSFSKLSKKCFIPQGSTMFRMTAIKKVGAFDPKLKTAEDWDLWLRLAEKFQVYYLPVPLYLYRINPKGLFSTAKKDKSQELDTKYVKQKLLQRQN